MMKVKASHRRHALAMVVAPAVVVFTVSSGYQTASSEEIEDTLASEATEEPTCAAPENIESPITTGEHGVQQWMDDRDELPVSDRFGRRIAELEYNRIPASDGNAWERQRAVIFEDAVFCSRIVEPPAGSQDVQIHFAPGTAEIERVEGWSSRGSLSASYVAHGYAWPYEVDGEEDARELSERRARRVLEWLSEHPDSEVTRTEWHGTAMTNDERYATRFEPLGAAVVFENALNLPRYTRYRGPALSDEEIARLLRLRENVETSWHRPSAVPALQFSHLPRLTVSLDADWLAKQEFDLEPHWTTGVVQSRNKQAIARWLRALVEDECDPSSLDSVELYPDRDLF